MTVNIWKEAAFPLTQPELIHAQAVNQMDETIGGKTHEKN
jgi:hypothetical protein